MTTKNEILSRIAAALNVPTPALYDDAMYKTEADFRSALVELVQAYQGSTHPSERAACVETIREELNKLRASNAAGDPKRQR